MTNSSTSEETRPRGRLPQVGAEGESADPKAFETTMHEAKAAKRPEAVGFFDLSREIRDMIYCELLVQPIGYGHARRRHKFETSILRVNTQIHQEASRVLYEENAWAIFEIRGPHAIDVPDGDYLTTISRVDSAGKLPFGGSPSLRVCIWIHGLPDFEVLHYVIVPLEWVMDMTRICIPGDIRGGPEYLELDEFIVHAQIHKNRKHESRQRMAVEFLDIIRGVGKAKIYGLPSPLDVSLAERMKTPIESIDELIDRTSMYNRRAELMRAQGHFDHAEELYIWGYETSNWYVYGIDAGRKKRRAFYSKLYESLEGIAFCSLRHGDSCRAYNKMKVYFPGLRELYSYRPCNNLMVYVSNHGHLSNSQRATGFYYYGLSMVAGGFDNDALFAFIQALVLVPGREGVDEEVDALEDRVGKSKTYNESRRSTFFKNLELFRPCRHKKVGEKVLLSRGKKRMLRRSFLLL